MTIQTTDKLIREAYQKATETETKRTLETLYPEVFENDLPYAEIGKTIFMREISPESIYVLQIIDGFVKLYNLTKQCEWNTKKSVAVHDLRQIIPKTVTLYQFKKIIDSGASQNLKTFKKLTLTTPKEAATD